MPFNACNACNTVTTAPVGSVPGSSRILMISRFSSSSSSSISVMIRVWYVMVFELWHRLPGAGLNYLAGLQSFAICRSLVAIHSLSLTRYFACGVRPPSQLTTVAQQTCRFASAPRTNLPTSPFVANPASQSSRMRRITGDALATLSCVTLIGRNRQVEPRRQRQFLPEEQRECRRSWCQ